MSPITGETNCPNGSPTSGPPILTLKYHYLWFGSLPPEIDELPSGMRAVGNAMGTLRNAGSRSGEMDRKFFLQCNSSQEETIQGCGEWSVGRNVTQEPTRPLHTPTLTIMPRLLYIISYSIRNDFSDTQEEEPGRAGGTARRPGTWCAQESRTCSGDRPRVGERGGGPCEAGTAPGTNPGTIAATTGTSGVPEPRTSSADSGPASVPERQSSRTTARAHHPQRERTAGGPAERGTTTTGVRPSTEGARNTGSVATAATGGG